MTNTAFFVFTYMAKCRIQNLKPPCGYQTEGITDIRLLDFDDFDGFVFRGDDLYSNCYVTTILRSGDYVSLDTPDTAKYSTQGEYTHTLETFIGDLSAELLAQLHLATKRRYIVTFRGGNGRYFVFGYEAGAKVSYVNQTAEGLGAVVTITASSVYPLFEWSGAETTCEWADFINIWEYVVPDAVCSWDDYINIWQYAVPTAVCAWDDFINIWKETCVNAYSLAYSSAYNCNSAVDWAEISPETVFIPAGGDAVDVQIKTDKEWTVE